jgi:hypothetical protein
MARGRNSSGGRLTQKVEQAAKRRSGMTGKSRNEVKRIWKIDRIFLRSRADGLHDAGIGWRESKRRHQGMRDERCRTMLVVVNELNISNDVCRNRAIDDISFLFQWLRRPGKTPAPLRVQSSRQTRGVPLLTPMTGSCRRRPNARIAIIFMAFFLSIC